VKPRSEKEDRIVRDFRADMRDGVKVDVSIRRIALRESMLMELAARRSGR
jgi:hypothetical protein